MKNQLVQTWNLVADNHFNPFKHMDLASRHYLIEVLAWMWIAIFSVSLLSSYVFGYVWLSHMLFIAGILMTLTIVKRAKTRLHKMTPAPYLSGASKCVWQMDREA
mgnify:CR=1 FL=1